MDEKTPRKDETTGGLIHDWVRPRDPDLPYPYIDWDTYAGVARKYVKGEKKGKWHMQSRSADLQANVDENKRLQNDDRNSFKVDGITFHRVASVPNYVVELWKKQGVDIDNPDHEAEVIRRLNDPDLKYFKTTHKTI